MIIGISGKKQSGKDTIGKIIQYFTIDSRTLKDNPVLSSGFVYSENYAATHNEWRDFYNRCKTWQKKMFADKLKQIVCLLLDCTMKQLEDNEFKEKELGVEWWYYKGRNGSLIQYSNNSLRSNEDLVKLTPRLVLQLLGTECGREIIHPNIWTNALFSDYKETISPSDEESFKELLVFSKTKVSIKYPNWIITDVRFPNEVKAIKDRDGILIRVNKNLKTIDNHPSETALDNYTGFNYAIDNNGSIEDLIDQVRIILRNEKII